MSWVWETELMPSFGDSKEWIEVLHLKKSWVSPAGAIDRTYKISAAWITRIDKRKWGLAFADAQPPKTFSTLKAAKAYAVAIVTLES